MSGRLSAAIAVLVLAARAAAGSVYFVATNGNNAFDGLSRTSAWRTLQRAIDGVGPGDTIRVMSGTYSGAAIRVSGTAAAPITLRADDGADVTLNARGPSNWHSSVLELEIGGTNQVAHWTIEGLRVVNSGRYGIDARIAHHLQIRSNRVFNSVSTGIFTAFCYDTLIEGNESASNGEHGIYYNNSGDRFAIRRNRLHHNTACGLQLNADASITNNPALDDGIIADGVIEDNVIYLNGSGGAGINLDGVVGAHGEIVADGQGRQFQPLFAEQGHVAEEAGVAGEVEAAAFGRQQEARGVSAVRAVGQGRAVQGQGQLEPAEGVRVAAADVLGVRPDPVGLQPIADFEVGDDQGPGALGDGQGVAQVVAVPVGDQDEIGGGQGRRQRGGGVAFQEGVDEDLVGAGLQAEGGVSEPGHSHGRLLSSDQRRAASLASRRS